MDYKKAWKTLKYRCESGIKTLEKNNDGTLENQITMFTYKQNLMDMEQVENLLKRAK